MADLTLVQFTQTVRRACDESDLVVSYNVRILDNTILKVRAFLALEAFIDVYFNPVNSNCSFALVRGDQRIYGADNAFIGWHLHPFEEPESHQPCGEVSFGEFLEMVEEWARGRRDATR